jgi:hypothetical protein
MYFSDFKVCNFFALFIRQALPITTNTTQTFIHKSIEKGNYNLKIYRVYKSNFHTFDIQNINNMFSWKQFN